jgi:hypothetical protein
MLILYITILRAHVSVRSKKKFLINTSFELLLLILLLFVINLQVIFYIFIFL